jgi:hypothetical protein
MGAVLLSRWRVSDAWIVASMAAGRFLPESGYGTKSQEHALLNKSFYVDKVSSSF